MTTRIKAPFATAKRTADVLGVSKSRFKLLERLAHANTIFNAKTSRDVNAVGKGSSVYFEKSARPKSHSAKSKSKMSRKSRKDTVKSGKGHSRAQA
jgi:ribosomal protein L19E